MNVAINSPIFAHLASADLSELGRIFGRVYVRFANSTNSQNELDASGESEAECASMKRETNGATTCEAHASATAREMTANERLDHAAETGKRVRCTECEPQPRRIQECAR